MSESRAELTECFFFPQSLSLKKFIHSLKKLGGYLVDFDMVGLGLIFRGFFNTVQVILIGHFTSCYPIYLANASYHL